MLAFGLKVKMWCFNTIEILKKLGAQNKNVF